MPRVPHNYARCHEDGASRLVPLAPSFLIRPASDRDKVTGIAAYGRFLTVCS